MLCLFGGQSFVVLTEKGVLEDLVDAVGVKSKFLLGVEERILKWTVAAQQLENHL